MPRVRTTTQSSSSQQTRRRKLASAATMLPLALGLAVNLTTPKAAHRGGAAPAAGAPIAVSYSLPFAPSQRHHAIDDAYSASGNSQPDSPQAAQNEAKNNFCAASKPVNIDFDVLHQLQQDAASAGVTFGSDPQLPKDRSLLHGLATKAGSIGEGTVVRLVAFVINAHPSNVGSGESVNCNRPDAESNDIQIALGQNSNHDDECSSVTAEMSPHFTPDAWNPNDLNQHNERLFRFTGQLFFDASHRPCSGSTGPNPKRSSLWEIHPIYAVEVCGDASNSCKVDSDANWIALSDFAGTTAPTNETLVRKPDWLGDIAPRAARTERINRPY
jgi:hypothetical protein